MNGEWFAPLPELLAVFREPPFIWLEEPLSIGPRSVKKAAPPRPERRGESIPPLNGMTEAWIGRVAPPADGFAVFADGRVGGLMLHVSSSGSKIWRLHYRLPGDRKKHSVRIGPWPAVKLQEARAYAESVKTRLIDGYDPVVDRQQRLRAARKRRGKEDPQV